MKITYLWSQQEKYFNNPQINADFPQIKDRVSVNQIFICELQKYMCTSLHSFVDLTLYLYLYIYWTHVIYKWCQKCTSTVYIVYFQSSDPPCCSNHFLSTEGDVGVFIRTDFYSFIGCLQYLPISNSNSFILITVYMLVHDCKKNCTDNTKHINIIEIIENLKNYVNHNQFTISSH